MSARTDYVSKSVGTVMIDKDEEGVVWVDGKRFYVTKAWRLNDDGEAEEIDSFTHPQ